MERKIDKILSRILPGGLPAYPGLPKRWYLYPYGLVIFFFSVLVAIYFISSNAIIEFPARPEYVLTISTSYLLPLILALCYIIRSSYRFWFISLSEPHTFEQFVSFAEFVKAKGNLSQTIIIYEFMLDQFADKDVSATEVNLGIAYLQRATKQDVLSIDRKKGITHLRNALSTKDTDIKVLALQHLRDHYISIEEKENLDEIDSELQKIKLKQSDDLSSTSEASLK
ncbi:hypothetical protein [Shimazuella alba]|uniref:Uncharacterized protein n=1 Tax=Shimazuella alba TaxID=2690964 RepID=A0A6I4VWH1_9BACL|nr:hypothetical protein [Shimazuella alba]MXQ54186.1 hypothetical protein [Shimazuella alba]